MASNRKKGLLAKVIYHVRKFSPEIENSASKAQFSELKESVDGALSKVSSLRWSQIQAMQQQETLFEVAACHLGHHADQQEGHPQHHHRVHRDPALLRSAAVLPSPLLAEEEAQYLINF